MILKKQQRPALLTWVIACCLLSACWAPEPGGTYDLPPAPAAPSWGQETEQPPEFFPAADVSAAQLELIQHDHAVASTAWGNFGPLEYWIVGTSVEAAGQHDGFFCALRMDRDPSLPEGFERGCIHRGYSFRDYARSGGAGLNTRRNNEEDYSALLVTLSSKYPFPDEPDYTVVTYHEYFHVVQHAHVSTRDEAERAALMIENPWWSEGGAEYMAQLLYSQQADANRAFVREQMERKLSSAALLAPGERFTDIPYGPRARIAYDLGAWFIAFLVDLSGEEAFRVGFFSDLETMGWEDAFAANFGASSEALLSDFDVFLQAPRSEQLAILP